MCWLMENEGLGIRRIGLFNQALLEKWLWWFGSETNHLWRLVIATKYGMSSGGWCTRVSRGAQGCGMWKNIRKGVESFFAHVLQCGGRGFSYLILV